MDKTVRLWHVSRNECLCTFKHSDFVPSIRFHPKDDRFFLAGSLDSKLRLWSIPDKSVAYWSQLPEMITAVSFTPDGKTAIAGCLNGICVFYDTDGLKYQTQIQVRSNHGKNAKGSKITGIQTAFFPPGDASGEVKILISSNDSRIRLYNLRDKSLELKFKGHENNYSQIRAAFTDDGRYIVCGSEDRKVYIWPTVAKDSEKQDKMPVENFEAHSTITTSAILAPTKTRQLLSASEDPVFDVCNPPPVRLVDKAESMISSKPPNSVDENGNDDGNDDGSVRVATPAASEASFRRPEVNPAYTHRAIHPGGHIVVTADYAGAIKVFRQDCAFKKRRPFADAAALVAANGGHGIGSELNGSTSLLSKRVAAGLRSRPVSTSASSTPATGNGMFQRGAGMILHAGESVAHPHLPASDRIQSWRHSIHGLASSSIDRVQSHSSLRNYGHASNMSSQRNSMSQVSMTSLRNGHVQNAHGSHGGKDYNNNKTGNQDANAKANGADGTHIITSDPPQESHPSPSKPFAINSKTTTDHDTTTIQPREKRKSRTKSSSILNRKDSPSSASPAPAPGYAPINTIAANTSFSSTSSGNKNDSTEDINASHSNENPLWIQGDQSYLFWDKGAYATQVEAAHRGFTAGSGLLDGATDGSFDSLAGSNNNNNNNSSSSFSNGLDFDRGQRHGHGYGDAATEDVMLSSSAATERPGMLSVGAARGSAAGRFRDGIRRPSEVSVLSSDLSDLSDGDDGGGVGGAGGASGVGGTPGVGHDGGAGGGSTSVVFAGDDVEDEQFVDAPDFFAANEADEKEKKKKKKKIQENWSNMVKK